MKLTREDRAGFRANIRDAKAGLNEAKREAIRFIRKNDFMSAARLVLEAEGARVELACLEDTLEGEDKNSEGED